MQKWAYMAWVVWEDPYSRSRQVLAARLPEREQGFDLAGVLEELGDAGWELVGIDTNGYYARGTGGAGCLYVFKRPKS